MGYRNIIKFVGHSDVRDYVKRGIHTGNRYPESPEPSRPGSWLPHADAVAANKVCTLASRFLNCRCPNSLVTPFPLALVPLLHLGVVNKGYEKAYGPLALSRLLFPRR